MSSFKHTNEIKEYIAALEGVERAAREVEEACIPERELNRLKAAILALDRYCLTKGTAVQSTSAQQAKRIAALERIIKELSTALRLLADAAESEEE